jgi:cyclophilin family peptidyl-prolyl cis-trans isomerase
MAEGRRAECVLQTSAADMRLTVQDSLSIAEHTFLDLAGRGFYDRTTFFRLVRDFIVQGGDPTGTGTGDVCFSIAGELPPAAFPYRSLCGLRIQRNFDTRRCQGG